jgi:hypothetical protein
VGRWAVPAPIEADSDLLVEYRSSAGQLDRHGNEKKQRRRDKKTKGSDEKVESASRAVRSQ